MLKDLLKDKTNNIELTDMVGFYRKNEKERNFRNNLIELALYPIKLSLQHYALI